MKNTERSIALWRSLLLVFPLLLVATTQAQTFPMQVITGAPVPPPYTYAELYDVATATPVTITNSGPTRMVRARVRLRNSVRNISIVTNDDAHAGTPVEVPAGGATFTLDELGDAFSGAAGFNASYFIFTGITPQQVEQDQLLPGPAWELCVQLLDASTGIELSAPFPQGCVSFVVPENQPPVLTDICGSTWTQPDGLLLINWLYQPPPGFDGDVQYRLRIVRIDPDDGRAGSANDAMLSATEPYLYDQVHDITQALIEVPDELLLDPGRRYAVRVTAFSPDGYLPVTNLGHSEVCAFTYAPEGMGGNGTLLSVWPRNDEWIPFDYPNVVLMFDPLRNYTRFTYNTTMQRAGGSALSPYGRTLNWPGGPPGSQSMVTFDISAYESQFLSVYHPVGGIPDNSFQRGERYRWRTQGDFTMGGNTYHGDTGEESFRVGMGPGTLQQPADGAVLPVGEVRLQWHTADAPMDLLPPFSVVQATTAGGTTFIDGVADHTWLLEVSRSSDFSTIRHSTNGRIQGAELSILNGLMAPGALRNALYRDLDHSFTASDTGTYYWRVHWKVDPTNTASANYNTSAVRSFCIGRCDSDGSTATATPPGAEEGDGACVSTCLEAAPSDRNPVGGMVVGSVVQVGKFSMTVQEVNASGTTFSGRGKIPVPFLNNAQILVDFTGLKWNAAGRMVSGDVVARKDWEVPGLSYISDNARRIPNMSEDAVNLMEGMIVDNARLVTFLMGGQEVGLPIGIDREVGGRQIILGIIEMKFDVERAYLDMAAGIEVPEIHTKLVFGVGDLCMTPSGLGDEGRAYLPQDITVTGDLSTSFRFRGGASTDLSNLTYVDWDCNGFKCMQIAGGVLFDRGTLLPPGDRDPAGTAKVEARFKFSVCRTGAAVRTEQHSDWNVMAAFTMDPFEVPGAPDWVFTVEEAWLDWSTIANPEGIVFPTGYTHPAIAGSGTRELWKGFYLKRLSMRTPEVIGDGTGAPLSAGVHNFMVDDQGELSFGFALQNLLAFNQGRIDSWAFSVDSVYMSMLQNNFQRAGLKGKIGLPINGQHDFVRYGAILGYDAATREFAFTLEAVLEDTLTAPLWIAEMQLQRNSYVRATLSNNSKVRAELNGSISISTALSSELGIDIGSMPSIRMPGMRFEQLVLDSESGISCGNCAFAYASPQKEVGGFPLSIRNLALEFDDPTRPALVVEPMVSLSGGEGESSFAASVALKFTTELTLGTNGVERFDFRDVQFTGMHLDVDVSALRLVGDLRITKTATKEEVKGALTVGFPMGIRGDLQACFGTIKLNPDVPINSSAQHYSYWMVDGMLYFNPGLMIMTGVGIYGFGGGAYHHMRFTDGTLPSNARLQSMAPTTPPGEIPPAQANAGTDPPNDFRSGLTADASSVGSSAAPSGGRYEEDYGTFLGIRLGLVFGTYPKPDGCNMDLTLRAEFTRAGGLSALTVRGDIYGLVDIPERANARITGQIGFSYANREGNEVIHANLAVMLDFVVARGRGAGNKLVDANFHTESATGKWYFIMGTPDNPGGIVVGPPGGTPMLTISNYIMVGNDSIPFNLPDPPQKIMEILGLNDPTRGIGTEAETRAAIGGSRDMGPLENGAGFAFGASFETELDINLAVLYATLGIALGFDLLLSEIPESLVCAETGQRPGDNGWYAQGQFYAGLWGEMGVQLELLFTRFRAPILNMSAAMLLQGNFPNPSGFRGHAAIHFSVLNGAVTGSATLQVEDGQQCTLMPAGDPLKDFDFIHDLGPKGNDVSIFDMPTASYNVALREVLEIPKLIRPDGSVELYRFHPFVHSFTLQKLVGKQAVAGNNQFNDLRGTSSHLARTNVLEPHTHYLTQVEVRVNEEFRPYQFREFAPPGTSIAWKEQRARLFRTGAAPDHIPASNVDYTYPVDRQRFFLQGESNNRGQVSLAMGMPYLFTPSEGGRTYAYLARFIPLGGGGAQETAITYSGGKLIPLTIPVLDPERIYMVQLVRRTLTVNGMPLLNLPAGMGGGVTQMSASIQAAQISTPLSQTYIGANGDVTRMNLTGGNVTRATSLASADHLLYSFRFRSSKYNTLEEKFASMELNGRTPARYDDRRNADVRGDTPEYFDPFDLEGVWKNGSRKLQPLVRINPDFNDNYYTYLNDRLYSLYLRLNNKLRYDFPGSSVTLPRYPVLHNILWGSRPEPVVRYNGWVDGPISDNESEQAAAPPVVNRTGGSPYTAGTVLNVPGGIGNTASVPGIFTGIVLPGIATQSTWHNFGFLYQGGKYASEDLATMRAGVTRAFGIPGTNGSTLGTLLHRHGPAWDRSMLMRYVYMPDADAGLRHTDNLPPPAQEFPVYYNANYHVVMDYRSPVAGSRNTRSRKPFTLRYEEPPVRNNGTVLY